MYLTRLALEGGGRGVEGASQPQKGEGGGREKRHRGGSLLWKRGREGGEGERVETKREGERRKRSKREDNKRNVVRGRMIKETEEKEVATR